MTLRNSAIHEIVTSAQEQFASKKYALAARTLEQLHGTEAGRTRQVRELLARSYYHSAQLGKAADEARALLAVDPTNADAAVLLTRALERAGRRDEAAPIRQMAYTMGRSDF